MPRTEIDRRIAGRIEQVDWARVTRELDAEGWSRLGMLLTETDSAGLIHVYAERDAFRSTVDMARHRFGSGEYRYFAHPLPPLVAALRTRLYARLAAVANRWSAVLGGGAVYPPTLPAYLAQCHAVGQTRPTPLLLHYLSGDYNCLHQDLYGELAFPLQVVVPLSEPARDYVGGELIFSEQRPRSQSRATAVVAAAGEAIAFANRERPVPAVRGFSRLQMRHGLSTVTQGERFALGIIFHDAR